MKPWYDPVELALSLGITLPLFFFYAWRIYAGIMKHREGLRFFCADELGEHLEELKADLKLEELSGESLRGEFLSAAVWNLYEERLGSVRRALRADAHTVILLGFFGTLVGVVGAFYGFSLPEGGAPSPVQIIHRLLRGGLATALVSSLVASVLAGLAITYLSLTEEKTARARRNLLKALREVWP